jgi:hypothetical protein
MGLSLVSVPGGVDLPGSTPLVHGLHNAPGRIINRNPATNTAYSRSLANEGGPQILIGATEAGTNWTPYNMDVSHPYRVPMPHSLMSTAQATGFYNSSVGAWPANGQDDQPSAYFNLIRLAPTTSAHRGYTNPTGPFPTQVFYSPPIFGLQTKPIYAIGL